MIKIPSLYSKIDNLSGMEIINSHRVRINDWQRYKLTIILKKDLQLYKMHTMLVGNNNKHISTHL